MPNLPRLRQLFVERVSQTEFNAINTQAQLTATPLKDNVDYEIVETGIRYSWNGTSYQPLGGLATDPSTGDFIANIIPRTGTLAALQALSGGTTAGVGELASATDTPAIVQYQSGTRYTYAPMSTGIWNDAIKALTCSAISASGTPLTVSGLSTSVPNTGGGSLLLTGGVTIATSGTGSGGLVSITGGNVSNAASSGSGGNVSIQAGTTMSTTASDATGGGINLQAGDTSATGANAYGGNINFQGGRSSVSYLKDGAVTISCPVVASPITICVARSSATAPGLAFFDKAQAYTTAPQSVGWGTPTTTGKVTNLPGNTATLAQVGNTLAQLILDLKAYGLLGA